MQIARSFDKLPAFAKATADCRKMSERRQKILAQGIEIYYEEEH